ncbi:MAG: DUF378 domain-containing protein [Oscillospiraceae bacterium]|nr:DUF378 domain-containing protein [Oscillospiraceae bacterium]
MKVLNVIALILVIIGAINWGLIGFFEFDLISSIFGAMTAFTRVIFALVGIAGLYSFVFFGRENYHEDDVDRHVHKVD